MQKANVEGSQNSRSLRGWLSIHEDLLKSVL
jgi:hypothetical protein